MKYFVQLSYNGENYHGWQIQKNGISVEEILEKCISIILNEPINIIGAGRTDKGVHAKLFTGHFLFINVLQKKIIEKLNLFLPNDITVFKILTVINDAHARYSAISRTYEYVMSKVKNPFFSYLQCKKKKYNIKMMNNASKLLIKYKFFNTFCKSNSKDVKKNCEMYKANWKKKRKFIVFEIEANRFLRNMVRSIVDTMLDLGIRKLNLEKFLSIIENRKYVGRSAPAKGLFLKKILYPKNIF